MISVRLIVCFCSFLLEQNQCRLAGLIDVKWLQLPLYFSGYRSLKSCQTLPAHWHLEPAGMWSCKIEHLQVLCESFVKFTMLWQGERGLFGQAWRSSQRERARAKIRKYSGGRKSSPVVTPETRSRTELLRLDKRSWWAETGPVNNAHCSVSHAFFLVWLSTG